MVFFLWWFDEFLNEIQKIRSHPKKGNAETTTGKNLGQLGKSEVIASPRARLGGAHQSCCGGLMWGLHAEWDLRYSPRARETARASLLTLLTKLQAFEKTTHRGTFPFGEGNFDRVGISRPGMEKLRCNPESSRSHESANPHCALELHGT